MPSAIGVALGVMERRLVLQAEHRILHLARFRATLDIRRSAHPSDKLRPQHGGRDRRTGRYTEFAEDIALRHLPLARAQ